MIHDYTADIVNQAEESLPPVYIQQLLEIVGDEIIYGWDNRRELHIQFLTRLYNLEWASYVYHHPHFARIVALGLSYQLVQCGFKCVEKKTLSIVLCIS